MGRRDNRSATIGTRRQNGSTPALRGRIPWVRRGDTPPHPRPRSHPILQSFPVRPRASLANCGLLPALSDTRARMGLFSADPKALIESELSLMRPRPETGQASALPPLQAKATLCMSGTACLPFLTGNVTVVLLQHRLPRALHRLGMGDFGCRAPRIDPLQCRRVCWRRCGGHGAAIGRTGAWRNRHEARHRRR